jgi:hypothetical protein
MTDTTDPQGDQTALRDRIAMAIEDAPYRHDGTRRAWQLADAVLAVLPAPADDAAGVAEAIRSFPFDNFGMDDVSFALEDDPEAQEWVPALAAAVLAVLPAPADRAAIYREVADRLAADAEQGEKEGFTRIYRRSAARQVREWADHAQQPETQAAADCPHGEGPGDGSGCIKPAGHDGDHVVTSGVTVVPCSRAVLHQQHIPHVWWPQPGMAYVHCPGHSVDTAAVSQPTVARQADTAGEQQ